MAGSTLLGRIRLEAWLRATPRQSRSRHWTHLATSSEAGLLFDVSSDVYAAHVPPSEVEPKVRQKPAGADCRVNHTDLTPMPILIVPSSVVGGSPLSAADLLGLRHQIPPYQRDFVWNTTVVDEFCSDLIAHYGRFAVGDELPQPEGYFLGAMVVVGEGEHGPFEVVDGQQRLTTLSALVSVLFDKLADFPVPEPHKSGYEQVARGCLGRFVGDKYEANLLFSDDDVAEFFINSCLIHRRRSEKETYWSTSWCQERLSKDRSTIARIRQALLTCYAKVDSFLADVPTNEAGAQRLMPFFRLVTECVVLLRIRAHSHVNAYAIFESLNNRGVRLSQADLIKNELLKSASLGNKGDIIDNWSTARQDVDASDVASLPEFLHFSYLSRHEKVKANDLLGRVKSRLGAGGQIALDYSQELVEDAAALNAMTASFDASWTSATTAMLKDIKNVLGIKLCYPFLFAAYRKHRGTPATFERYVRLVMNAAFRHLKVVEGSLEALSSAVNTAATGLSSGKSFDEVATPFRDLAPDALFQQAFESVSFSNTKLAYFAVYYLEAELLHGTMPLPHGQDSNLEHIMPRTPTAATWPAVTALKNSAPEVFRDYLWRLGNLLPLPEAVNKSLKNKSISHKISNGTGNDYMSPALTLVSPKEVSNYLVDGEWTYESIVNRQKALAGIATKAFTL